MPLRLVGMLVCVVVLATSACQSSAPGQVSTDNASIAAPTDSSAPSPAPTPTPDQPANARSSIAPSPTAAATQRAASQSAVSAALANSAAASAALSVGAQSRVELLKMADTAYASKDLARAQTLYRRVITNSPDASESIAQTRAVTGFAEFRLLLTFVSMGNDEGGQQLLRRLRSANAVSPFTRLASDFWDQYGMTVSVEAGCNAIENEVARQAASEITELQGMGVSIGARQLCVPPGD